jgi:hypothetical protein
LSPSAITQNSRCIRLATQTEPGVRLGIAKGCALGRHRVGWYPSQAIASQATGDIAAGKKPH